MAEITDPRSFGAELRAARRRAGLSQQALATSAGISRLTLSLIERGHPAGEFGKVLAVVRALGLQVALEPARPSTFNLDILDQTTTPL